MTEVNKLILDDYPFHTNILSCVSHLPATGPVGHLGVNVSWSACGATLRFTTNYPCNNTVRTFAQY